MMEASGTDFKMLPYGPQNLITRSKELKILFAGVQKSTTSFLLLSVYMDSEILAASISIELLFDGFL
jgi:hypothetical protein